jgi:hypothetical protein
VRFLALVLAAVVFGAVTMFSLQTVFPEHKASMVAAVRAAGASVSQFHLSDLNPVRRAYDHVASEITSPSSKLDFPSSPVVVGDPLKFRPVEIGQLGIGGAMNNGPLPSGTYRGTVVRCGRYGVTLPCD